MPSTAIIYSLRLIYTAIHVLGYDNTTVLKRRVLGVIKRNFALSCNISYALKVFLFFAPIQLITNYQVLYSLFV